MSETDTVQTDERLTPLIQQTDTLRRLEGELAVERAKRNKMVYQLHRQYCARPKAPTMTVADIAAAGRMRHSYARRIILDQGKPRSGSMT